MKDDIYDLRDWLEREGKRGKQLLTQILKHEGKIDELLEKIKVRKEDEASKDAEIKQLKETIQKLENFNAQGRAELQQAKADLQDLTEQVTRLKNLFDGSVCKDGSRVYASFNCLLPEEARRILKIPPSNQSQEYIN
jgi:chromosome segregation ATPase